MGGDQCGEQRGPRVQHNLRRVCVRDARYHEQRQSRTDLGPESAQNRRAPHVTWVLRQELAQRLWRHFFGQKEPVPDALGTNAPVAGVAGVHVHVGTLKEDFVGRLAGRYGRCQHGSPRNRCQKGTSLTRPRRAAHPGA